MNKEDRQYFYKLHLEDKRWKQKSKEIRERDKVCQYCESEKYLHVHHVRYLPNKYPWDYPDEYLILLCAKCHQEEHRRMREVDNAIAEMRLNGLNSGEILSIIRK